MGFKLSNPTTMPPATGGYSQLAVVRSGKLVLIAGQIAHDSSGNLVGKDDFRAQVEQIFKNLGTALAAAGGNFQNLVKISNHCVDRVEAGHLSAYREVRDRYINVAAPPVSTFVYVSRLVRPDWLFEMDAMAIID